MSPPILNIVANVLIVLGFGAALVAVLVMPSREGGFVRPGIKLLLGGAMSIYAFVGVSHILQFTGVTDAFDIFENYLRVLFIPLVSATLYIRVMGEQLSLVESQDRVLRAEHDMLMRIVDTTPTGVLVLSADGRIEYANDRARRMLDLSEDPDTASFRAPAWRCRDDGQEDDLWTCVSEGPVRDRPCLVAWPDGTTLAVVLSATPIVAADETVAGAVVALMPAEPEAVSA